MISDIELVKKSTLTILSRYKEIFDNPNIVRELKHFAPAALERVKILDPVENRYNPYVKLPTTQSREIRALYALRILQQSGLYNEGDELLYTTLYYSDKPRGSARDYSDCYPIGMEIGVQDKFGNSHTYLAQGAIPVKNPSSDAQIIHLDESYDELTNQISLATADGFAMLSTALKQNKTFKR